VNRVSQSALYADEPVGSCAAEEGEIVLPGVDTRDGPPNKRIQECAIMLRDQQAILLVDRDLLTREKGSGAPMNAWARSSTSPRA
jgi:hypothetical protein